MKPVTIGILVGLGAVTYVTVRQIREFGQTVASSVGNAIDEASANLAEKNKSVVPSSVATTPVLPVPDFFNANPTQSSLAPPVAMPPVPTGLTRTQTESIVGQLVSANPLTEEERAFLKRCREGALTIPFDKCEREWLQVYKTSCKSALERQGRDWRECDV